MDKKNKKGIAKYPISFKTNYFRPLKVFENKITFPKDLIRTVTIPARQIASAEKSVNGVVIETAGGKKHLIPMLFSGRNEAINAIMEIIS